MGEYEAVVSFDGDPGSKDDTENVLAAQESRFSFVVSEAPSTHFVTLTAADSAADDVILTIGGKAGAVVRVSYTTPGGAPPKRSLP